MAIDFDEWTAKVTERIKCLSELMLDVNKRIEILEKELKEIKDARL